MSHLITLSLSEAEMTSLSQEADAAGASIEDLAHHLLCSPRSPQNVATGRSSQRHCQAATEDGRGQWAEGRLGGA